MNEGLKYSYEDLVKKSTEIMTYTTTFDTQIGDLLAATREVSNTYQSETAERIVEAINTVTEDADDFKAAIKEFARAIGEEIAPAYKAIEEKAAANAEGIYGG